MTGFLATFLVYVIVTFAIAYVWHLHLFGERYRALEVYRESILPPLGLASMIIQGVCFAMVYGALFAPMDGFLARAAAYAVFGALFSWSFTTLASAAKNRMTSIRGFVAVETAFTLVQWAAVAPLTAALG